ncbi:hypothetical protein BDW02DRAFT_585538 [Decorospora gaudefroyi]|uniref:Uncharacterized protein n=1 Tax=Decorospora gaudefroyi TaxID=184978 RepID=A0A6A5KKJ7_9PLEO|nr:hypothetical protein BDW02DRAFT_585538 [Decorospora gaudefroyi]
MPSFKSKLLSACVWAAPVLYAAVIPSREREVARADGKLLQLHLQEDYAQATFSVPCNGCLGHPHTGHDDESLTLSFTSHSQAHACGSSNITLNGVYLPQEWNGDSASGAGSYQGVTDLTQNEWYLQRDLDLEWETACLHANEETEAAQVVTVNIKAIDGKPIKTPSGFTISFKQQTSPPSLLRLESVPNPSASNRDVAESWREPPRSLRLFSPNNTEDKPEESESSSLEDEIRELNALESELQKLQLVIAEKKKQIHSQLRKETKKLSHELGQCDGIRCIFKTIAHKAHGAWNVLYIRFQSNRHHQSEEMGRPEQAFAKAHGQAVQVAQVSEGHLKRTTNQTKANLIQNELPPRPPKVSPYILALDILVGVLCCSCLLAVVCHKCSSLRSRTERAAAREEWMNAHAYRRAARQHAWRNWWCGNWVRRDQERMADYEEKRALISAQEDVLEDAMQEEIRQLRVAHDVVNDLVRDAEEGRVIGHASCHCQHQTPYSPLSTASTYPPTSLPEIPSRPLSRTDSLPSYRSGTPTEPPSYESEVEAVANGFRHYTVAASTTSEVSSHWTPDSSVVDVSPRPSAETLRYPQSVHTLDEEESDAD